MGEWEGVRSQGCALEGAVETLTPFGLALFPGDQLSSFSCFILPTFHTLWLQHRSTATMDGDLKKHKLK